MSVQAIKTPSDVRQQVSKEEWQTRVDLAAAYRLVALYGWDDLVFTHISVRLPTNAGYRVKARTSFGRINSQLPITASGAMGGDSLEGTIGNGGCALDLTNSNGNIDISRAQ